MPGIHRSIAYFSMEIAVDSAMPTYSGGLGVLAGDTIRTAVDMDVPMVAVTLLHRKGYFTQKIDESGWQHEEPVEWQAEKFLEELPQRASVELEGRSVYLRAWRYRIRSSGGFSVPVYFLDTDIPENAPGDRALTHYLYGGDNHYRLCQEAVFGIGGVRMLHLLGYEGIKRYHMNEGHAALLTLDLLASEARKAERAAFTQEDVNNVRWKCVFTTHTPISAGHDRFPADLVERVLRYPEIKTMPELFFVDGTLDMTHMAMSLSNYVNGVAKKHGEVSSQMFSRPIDSITNGVHLPTWTSPPMQKLFDKYIPDWRKDNLSLRYALTIPKEELWRTHQEAKQLLFDHIQSETGVSMDPDTLTIGFARRATGYKRAWLLLNDPGRLKAMAGRHGGLQIVYGGKAHPHDEEGKAIIQKIIQSAGALAPEIKIVYLQNYIMEIGKLITAGVDLWLNTPQPPLEASGTSGMKAAINGVPSLSILDGWWMEGHLEGVTGWSIGEPETPNDRTQADAQSLYGKLDETILPLFRNDRPAFVEVMRHAIALNGSFFNTQRMMYEYVLKAYFR